MAEIRSTYPPGASQTNVTMDGRDPALYLQALIERERQVANKPPVFVAKKRGGGLGMNTRVQGRAGRGSEGGGAGARPAAAAASGGGGSGPGGLSGAAAVTPRSLGRFQMNHTGNWGTFVDPLDIPAGLQDSIMGGFYGGTGNWDSSNPSIMGPQQWKTGKYTHNGSTNFPSQMADPDAADAVSTADDWRMAYFRQFGRMPGA